MPTHHTAMTPSSRPIIPALLLAMASLSPSPVLAAPATTPPGRLPLTARPQHYAVHLRPDVGRNAFSGDEMIQLMVDRPTTQLVLHANQLVARAVRLDGKTAPAAIVANDEAETLTLRFKAAIAPGPHTLALAFTGQINTLPRGLFATPYQVNGQRKVMLGTELEPTDARRIFPLWDEPGYRASFTLSVDVPKGQTAVSNMPVASQRALVGTKKTAQPAPTLTRVTFKPTPKMPSYLLVLCMGEFERLSKTIAGVDVGVLTTAGKRNQGQYALDAVAELLPAYNAYFGTPYPLPKLDLIARPGGFGGAMENWGGITFFEPRLLLDPKTASQADREGIFAIIAHELAHQWFGNLVTMAWWDDLWLNEGFASWMEVKIAAQLHPTWRPWLANRWEHERTLLADSLSTTHPIQAPVVNAADADAAFDDITYGKGQAVIRMLEGYLGEAVFQKAIQTYMKRHAYGNARTQDLWAALAAASGQPIDRVANAWTTRPGFPLVSAAFTSDGAFTLSQARFRVDGTGKPEAPWPIPLVYQAGEITGSGTDGGSAYRLFRPQSHPVLFDAMQRTLPLAAGPTAAPFFGLLNQGGVGYYRVRYTGHAATVASRLFSTLSTDEQMVMLSDAWALATSEHEAVPFYAGLLTPIGPDADAMLWSQVVSELATVQALQPAANGAPSPLDAWIRGRLQGVFARVGWTATPGEDPAIRKLRPDLVTLLGRAGDPAVLAETHARFTQFVATPARLDGDLRQAVLALVGRFSTAETRLALRAIAKKGENVKVSREAYDALAGTQDAVEAAKVLELTLAKDFDPGLAVSLLHEVSKIHPTVTRNFLKRHAQTSLRGRPAQDQAEVIAAAFHGFTDEAGARELESYARATIPADGWPEITKAAARVRYAARLRHVLVPALQAAVLEPEKGH